MLATVVWPSAMTKAIGDYEALIQGIGRLPESEEKKIGSMFMGNAKSFLVSAKQLMRRVRDKVPYSAGDRMMINAGSSWMIEGTPGRLLRDYNQMIDGYNRGANI